MFLFLTYTNIFKRSQKTFSNLKCFNIYSTNNLVYIKKQQQQHENLSGAEFKI